MAAENLVIVESPSKAKTIGKYLGTGYNVIACMGHLRDLPKSSLGIDIENDFEPQYVAKRESSSIIKELKSAAAKSDTVYLATDPDREGEAISWHLQALLNIPEGKSSRVTFNEITKKVVEQSIRQPRAIDMNLVDAQQARRVLDRIVGYKLSPLLWKHIKGGPRGLSAGRVQSAALKLVVDRENEILRFIPEEYWSIDLTLNRSTGESYPAKFYGDPEKKSLNSESEMSQILTDISGKNFTVNNVKRSTKKRSSPPPFNTSSLQQDASRKLNMSPKRTMALAQQLYEGVEISGVGAVGLITYMRTDSLRISEEALSAAKDYITDTYSSAYYYGSPRRFKSSENSQDAHEAIRPTDVRLTPERIAADLNRDQLRLYKLIWTRFVASQMANAEFSTLNFDNVCGKYIFKSSFQTLTFPGYTALYDDKDDEAEDGRLSDVKNGEQAELLFEKHEQHFTQPPVRYTEASLVKAMEENGVGRPSTYATIISTIQERQYVQNKDKHLIPTDVGTAVNLFLEREFNDIVDIDFTANMEKRLDLVAEGEIAWKNVIRDFYGDFEQNLERAATSDKVVVPTEELNETCPECGSKLIIRYGRFGKFIACESFPKCSYTRAIVERAPGRCPKCGSGMLKKKSMHGKTYYSCETGNDCFMSWDVPTDLDCPHCGNTLFKKAGKGNQATFCINPSCESYLPEDKRGYYRRKTETSDSTNSAVIQKPVEKTSAKKRTVKKAASSDRSVKKAGTSKKATGSKSQNAVKTSRKKKTE